MIMPPGIASELFSASFSLPPLPCNVLSDYLRDLLPPLTGYQNALTTLADPTSNPRSFVYRRSAFRVGYLRRRLFDVNRRH